MTVRPLARASEVVDRHHVAARPRCRRCRPRRAGLPSIATASTSLGRRRKLQRALNLPSAVTPYAIPVGPGVVDRPVELAGDVAGQPGRLGDPRVGDGERRRCPRPPRPAATDRRQPEQRADHDRTTPRVPAHRLRSSFLTVGRVVPSRSVRESGSVAPGDAPTCGQPSRQGSAQRSSAATTTISTRPPSTPDTISRRARGFTVPSLGRQRAGRGRRPAHRLQLPCRMGEAPACTRSGSTRCAASSAPHPAAAEHLRGMAERAFATPQPRPGAVGLLSKLGPIFRRPPATQVISPTQPEPQDVEVLLAGAYVPPERMGATWRVLETLVSGHRLGLDPDEPDRARARRPGLRTRPRRGLRRGRAAAPAEQHRAAST